MCYNNIQIEIYVAILLFLYIVLQGGVFYSLIYFGFLEGWSWRMELTVKFCMIYFTRSGVSFPGFYLVPVSHPLKCQIASEQFKELPAEAGGQIMSLT
jgi:hypothetical protein